MGRQAELDAILQALVRPDCSGVLLVGGAGLGKTRMALEVLEAAESRGWASDWVVATASAAEIPFGALARWLPHQGVAPVASSGVAVFHAAARDLADRAAGRQLVIGIDDIDHLDPASAVLLHHLVCIRAAKVVFTLRSRTRAPDPIVNLWKDGLVRRVELGPLTRSEADVLLAGALGGAVDRGLTERFWRASAGNLLYLRELVSATKGTDALEFHAGRWLLLGDLSASAPLTELIETRIGALTVEEREVLELVGMGEPLPLGILDGLVRAEAVATLEQAELVVAARDRQRDLVHLAHPLYAEALRASCGPLRARTLARRLAQAYLATGLNRRGDLLQYVVWELDSGGACDGPLLRGAARLALEGSDPVLGERLSRAALSAEPDQAEGIFLLAEALSRLGRYEECLDLFQPGPDTPEPARTLLRRGRIIVRYWVLGQCDEAYLDLDSLEGETRGESRLMVKSLRSTMLCHAGEVAVSADLDRAILAQATDPTLIWEVKQRLSFTLAMMGCSAEAMALAGECLQPALRPEAAIPVNVDLAMAAMAMATFYSGLLETTGFMADQVYADGLSLDHLALRLAGSSLRATVAAGRGDVAGAGALLAEAVSLLPPADVDGLRALVLGMQVGVAALAGELELAQGAADQARRECHPALTWFVPLLDQGRALALAAAGHIARAVDALDASAVEVRRRGQLAFEVNALLDMARLGSGSRVADRLEELAGTNDGALVRWAARYARAATTGSGSDLDAAAAGFQELGMLLVAAEIAGDAATAHRRSGDRMAEARSLRSCRQLAERCPGVAPWVFRDRLERDILTNREREVARLVASGLSNKAVALQLTVSVRTVESHLDRVYSKLGITDRARLAEVLGPSL